MHRHLLGAVALMLGLVLVSSATGGPVCAVSPHFGDDPPPSAVQLPGGAAYPDLSPADTCSTYDPILSAVVRVTCPGAPLRATEGALVEGRAVLATATLQAARKRPLTVVGTARLNRQMPLLVAPSSQGEARAPDSWGRVSAVPGARVVPVVPWVVSVTASMYGQRDPLPARLEAAALTVAAGTEPPDRQESVSVQLSVQGRDQASGSAGWAPAASAVWAVPMVPWVAGAAASVDGRRDPLPTRWGAAAQDKVLMLQTGNRSVFEVAAGFAFDLSERGLASAEPRVAQQLKEKYTPGGPDNLCNTPDDGQGPVSITATRPGSAVKYIVLHSTGGGNPKQRFQDVLRYALASRTCFWAHYYVDKDGTVVQVTQDPWVAHHVCANGILGVNNSNSIGIELFNTCNSERCMPDEPYPGRQLSAIVRLMDSLIRKYPGIVRPSSAGRGNIRMHQEVNPTRRTDPTGSFRTTVMGSPSIEEVIYRALRREHQGLVIAEGGGGLDAADRGRDGEVSFEYGVTGLADPVKGTRPSLVVPVSRTVTVPGTTRRLRLMHLLVEGTLNLSADLEVDLDGILYVGPQGVINAAGSVAGEGADGHSLTITADGFALIEGQINTSGAYTRAPGQKGGSAGNLIFRSASPGPALMPGIATRSRW